MGLLNYLYRYLSGDCSEEDTKFNSPEFNGRWQNVREDNTQDNNRLDRENSSGKGFKKQELDPESEEFYLFREKEGNKDNQLDKRRLLRLAGTSLTAGVGISYLLDKVTGEEDLELTTNAEAIQTENGIKEFYEINNKRDFDNVNGILELEEDKNSFEADVFEYGLGLQTHTKDLDNSPVAILYKQGEDSFQVEYYEGEKDLGALHPDLEFNVEGEIQFYEKSELANLIYEKAKNESSKNQY